MTGVWHYGRVSANSQQIDGVVEEDHQVTYRWTEQGKGNSMKTVRIQACGKLCLLSHYINWNVYPTIFCQFWKRNFQNVHNVISFKVQRQIFFFTDMTNCLNELHFQSTGGFGFHTHKTIQNWDQDPYTFSEEKRIVLNFPFTFYEFVCAPGICT